MGTPILNHIVTELVNQIYAGILEVLFSNWILAGNNETNFKTGTAQAVFNGRRMDKLEPSLQINFSNQFRWMHQTYRRVMVKGRDLGKSRRNIHELSENRCGYDLELL